MDKPRRAAYCAALGICVFLLGCATAPTELRYETIADGPIPVWPGPPDPARYRYVGQLTGEQNIHGIKSEALGKRVLGWIVGLVAGRAAPVVLQRPQGGFVDEAGRIYVTDVSRGAVYLFDEPGGVLRVWEWADRTTRFKTPVGIAAGPDGTLLVADADLQRVFRLGPDGESLGSFGAGELKRPTGLARDAERGRVYVADTHGQDIKVYDDSGTLLSTIGGPGVGDGEFNGPTYLTFDGDRLYVTDTLNARIEVFGADGTYLRKFGRRGLFVGDLPRPKGVAVDTHHNVYVVESYYDYLLVFNDKGEFLLPIGGTGSGIGQFFLPAGVWTDHRNRVYVADAFNGRVVIFQYLGDA
jgi:DNA-binding beta-propeller fold protein YncE